MARGTTSAAQAFADAEQDLKAAIQKFDMARAQFARESGKHMTMDDRLIKAFNQVTRVDEQATDAHTLAEF